MSSERRGRECVPRGKEGWERSSMALVEVWGSKKERTEISKGPEGGPKVQCCKPTGTGETSGKTAKPEI